MQSSVEYQSQSRSHRLPSRASTNHPLGNNTSWIPPPRGALKLNVDAHPCDNGRWGLGMVLRTEEGKCVGARTVLINGLDETLDGEALGLNEAIGFVRTLGDAQIIIEMDSSTIVDVVKQRRYNRCYYGRIVRKAGAFLDNNHRVSINWIRRAGNNAADCLAKWAMTEPNKTWTNETPLGIMEIIQRETLICNIVP